MTTMQLRTLARLTKTRVAELEQEALALRAAYPALFEKPKQQSKPKRRRRRRLSADQKLAVSKRMKKYWAAKRKGEA